MARRGFGLERRVVRGPRREHEPIDPLSRPVQPFVHDDSHELRQRRRPIRGAPDRGRVRGHEPLEGEPKPPPIRSHSRKCIALDSGPEPQVLRVAILRAEQPLPRLASCLTARLDEPLLRESGIASEGPGAPNLERILPE